MEKRPLFSILHTTARPLAWRKAYDDWMSKAVHPEDVEYVLCVDERWGFTISGILSQMTGQPNQTGLPLGPISYIRVVFNTGRLCYVDGVSTAAAASTGSILIVNSDDIFACEKWDEKLAMAAPGSWRVSDSVPFVVSVSTGTLREHERKIMPMPILSRKRYQDLGYVFYPEYESMYADNDFCEHAQHDGIVMIDARHLMFPHRHPAVDSSVPIDEVYRHENRAESYALGESILKRRRAANFAKEVMPSEAARQSSDTETRAGGKGVLGKALDWLGWRPPTPAGDLPGMVTAFTVGADHRAGMAQTEERPRQREIAILAPGESHRAEWEAPFLSLVNDLANRGWRVQPWFDYSTNVYHTRMILTKHVLDHPVKPEYVLWLDDDNVLLEGQLQRMIAYLDAHSEVAGIAGWCFIRWNEKGWITSCGQWSPTSKVMMRPFAADQLCANLEPKAIDATGFPAFLMRYEVLAKLGPESFAPIFDAAAPWGFSGEDFSFCRRAADAGFHFVVDPAVKVVHLKLRADEPDLVVHADAPPEIKEQLSEYREKLNGKPVHMPQASYEVMGGKM